MPNSYASNQTFQHNEKDQQNHLKKDQHTQEEESNIRAKRNFEKCDSK